MNFRAVILSTAVLFGFLAVALRLGDLMLFNHESLAERAMLQHQGEKDLLAKRGGIFDRRGRPLAVNLDVESVYVNPREVDSPREAAKALARLTGDTYDSALGKVASRRHFVWAKRKLDPELVEDIRKRRIRGLGFLDEVKRYYPKGTLAAHLIGLVGIDNQPLEGLELWYDGTLHGRPGKLHVKRDAAGRTLSDGEELQTWGNSLRLTIDEGLQYIAENALEKTIEKWSAVSASVIMMNPYTGEVLAMANRPTYDLNTPADYKTSARRNRALTDTYEPGSTFKIVAAAAALEEGVASPDTEFDCSEGRIEVAGMVIRDVHSDHTPLTFREIIQRSSNVGTVMVGQDLGEELFYEYATRFGFGRKVGIDLPGEADGSLAPPEKWWGTSLAAMSIGYEVSVTPLQLLRAYSAIANGGYLVKPHLVSEIISPEGAVLYREDHDERKRIISERTAGTLREILVSVTHQGGTALNASVDGNRVAGKTGTTKLIDPETGRYSSKKYVGSFVGFVPADMPRIAIIVVVREPQGQFYGGLVAAPAFKEIADKSLAYLNIPREDTFKDNMLLVRTGGFE
ncbi:MAG: penicillin-binding protein 2 [Nitrospirota bacterium]|jgi:cell division protein FtsI (penicillin-binding protein 3)